MLDELGFDSFVISFTKGFPFVISFAIDPIIRCLFIFGWIFPFLMFVSIWLGLFLSCPILQRIPSFDLALCYGDSRLMFVSICLDSYPNLIIPLLWRLSLVFMHC